MFILIIEIVHLLFWRQKRISNGSKIASGYKNWAYGYCSETEYPGITQGVVGGRKRLYRVSGYQIRRLVRGLREAFESLVRGLWEACEKLVRGLWEAFDRKSFRKDFQKGMQTITISALAGTGPNYTGYTTWNYPYPTSPGHTRKDCRNVGIDKNIRIEFRNFAVLLESMIICLSVQWITLKFCSTWFVTIKQPPKES